MKALCIDERCLSPSILQASDPIGLFLIGLDERIARGEALFAVRSIQGVRFLSTCTRCQLFLPSFLLHIASQHLHDDLSSVGFVASLEPDAQTAADSIQRHRSPSFGAVTLATRRLRSPPAC